MLVFSIYVYENEYLETMLNNSTDMKHTNYRPNRSLISLSFLPDRRKSSRLRVSTMMQKYTFAHGYTVSKTFMSVRYTAIFN